MTTLCVIPLGNILPLSYDIFDEKIALRWNTEQLGTFEVVRKLSCTKLSIKLNDIRSIQMSLFANCNLYYTFQLIRIQLHINMNIYHIRMSHCHWVLQDVNQILLYYLKNYICKKPEIMGSLNKNKISK